MSDLRYCEIYNKTRANFSKDLFNQLLSAKSSGLMFFGQRFLTYFRTNFVRLRAAVMRFRASASGRGRVRYRVQFPNFRRAG